MLVNRVAVLVVTFSCISVCWAAYPDVEAMVNNVPSNAIIAPNGVALKTAVQALPYHQQVIAWQSLSPLADGSLMVASEGSKRQFIEAIDDRLRRIPPLCKDLAKGISSGDTTIDLTQPTQQPAQTIHVQPANEQPQPVKTTQPSSEPKAINADPMQSPLNPTIHKVDPSVQKVLLESWATQPTSDKKTKEVQKEADLAKKETDLAKKEADLAKKEAESKAKETKEGDKAADDITLDASTSASKDITADDKSTTDITVSTETASVSAATTTTVYEEPYRCNGVWIQAIGSRIDQSIRDNIFGYDAHLWGLNIGRDAELSPEMRAGFAIGYQRARAYSDEYSGSFFDVKRFQLSTYGRFNYWCCFYTQWALTGAFNRYDNKRKILIYPSYYSPLVDTTAHGTFTAWEYDVYLEKGFTWTQYDFQINPKIFLDFTHLNPEGYFEKDAYGLNLSVKYQDMDVLKLATGFKLMYQAQFEKAFVVPEGHIYYFYSVMNDKQFGRAAFAGVDPFYTQGVKPEASNLEIGGALAVHSCKYVMIKLAYDVNWNRDYHRQQGYIQVRYEWA